MTARWPPQQIPPLNFLGPHPIYRTYYLKLCVRLHVSHQAPHVCLCAMCINAALVCYSDWCCTTNLSFITSEYLHLCTYCCFQILQHLHTYTRKFWPLDLDVEVYVDADDVVYSYQLTIPQHSLLTNTKHTPIHSHFAHIHTDDDYAYTTWGTSQQKLDDVISINIHFHIKI